MHAGRSGIGVSLGVARRKLTVTVRLPSDRTRLREVSSQPYSNALAAGLAASNKGQALSCSLFRRGVMCRRLPLADRAYAARMRAGMMYAFSAVA